MPQEYFNLLISACGIMGGWILKTIWAAVQRQQDDTKELADRVGEIEVLVAGEYIKREEFEKVAQRIFDKLDMISEKLNAKADR